MSNDEKRDRSLSRRDLLKRAGLAGLAASTGGLVESLPRGSLSVALADDTVEGAIATIYGARAQGMSAGNASFISQYYDPANPALLTFERNRVAYFHNQLGQVWNVAITDYASSVSLQSLTLEGDTAHASLYETTTVTWIPLGGPVQLTQAARNLRTQFPDKFPVPTRPAGNRHTSYLGMPHDITLLRGTKGWYIASDAYNERFPLGASPDYLGQPLSAAQTGSSRATMPKPGKRATSSGMFATDATCIINWTDVQNYAKTWCNTRNSNYCNYTSCGGDCSNFVSQCWTKGSMHWDGTWYCTTNGSCNCGSPSVAQAGSLAFINVNSQWNWLIGSGRGQSEPNQTYLGIGDLINYDWGGDGVFDHASIVSGFDSNYNCLICAHATDECNVPWPDGGAMGYRYAFISSTYNC
jgi:hypothetical protein